MTGLNQFIDAMRRKYLPLAGGEAAPGVVSPSPGAAQNARFTGRGADGRVQVDEPAGVVHEGEMVVEAEAVKNAGGPGAIRDEVDRLVIENGRGFRSKVPPEGGGDTFNPAGKGFRGGTGKKVVKGYKKGTGRGVVKGYQTGTGDDTVPSGQVGGGVNVPGLSGVTKTIQNIGEGFQNLVENPPEPQEVTEPPRTDATAGRGGTPGSTPPVDVPAPGTTEIADIPPTLGQRTVQGAITSLEDVAAGRSRAADIGERRARTALEGAQAVETQAQAQELAQQDIRGGQAAAERARLARQQEITRGRLETDLAQSRAERAEQATRDLAQVGIQQQDVEARQAELEEVIRKNLAGEEFTQQDIDIKNRNLDEIIRKNQAGEALSESELALQQQSLDEIARKNRAGEALTGRELDIRQQAQDTIDQKVASDIALTEQEIQIRGDKFNMEKNQLIADQLIKKGQFGLAEQVLNDMGMDLVGEIRDAQGNIVNLRFDLSDAQRALYDERTFTALGNAANIINNTEQGAAIGANITADAAWEELQKAGNLQLNGQLRQAWEWSVRDPDGKIPKGQEWGSEESRQWAKDNIVSTQLQNDAFYQAADNISDDTLSALLASSDLSLGEFEFAGRTGEGAARLALTNIMASGGLSFDADGNMTVDAENPAWAAMGITKGEEAEVEEAFKPIEEVSDDKFTALIKGTDFEGKPVDIRNISQVEWANMTDSQWNEIQKLTDAEGNDIFGSIIEGTSFKRLSDFNNAGLKADVVFDTLNDLEKKPTESSAGQGQGSLIIYNGEPYRIVEAWTKKDTAGNIGIFATPKADERRTRIYAVPLRGGPREIVADSGWYDI